MWRLAVLSALGITYVLADYERTYDDLGTVILSSVLFRHGDRAPCASFPNDPYKNETLYWPRGFGQLTELGEEQHYKLGSYLRERYAHMLPLVYNVNDTYIRSTNYDRTLMSAQCNLAGLYPWIEGNWSNSPIKFQAIPIHTETIPNDNILLPYLSCTKYLKLLSYLKDSDEYECVMKATAEVQKDVAKLAGLDQFDPIIADTLYVEETHNLRIPDSFSPYYPNPLMTMNLFFNYLTGAGTRELQKLAAGPLMKEMVNNMQHKANGTLDPDRCLYIYSAHDVTVVNLLQALNVFNGILVPYASAVLVELRELLGSYYTTVFYKNSTTTDPYLLQIPGCKPLCPLDRFIDLTKDIIPDNASADCAEEVEEEKEYDFEVPVNAVLPEWKPCFKNPKARNKTYYAIVLKAPEKKLQKL